ncbi:chloride channel protein [Shigella flexneri]
MLRTFWCAIRARSRGIGIPEIEGALEDQRPVRWRRVLPVKFFGGRTLGGGMAPGRRTNRADWRQIGRMVLDIFRLKGDEARHTLLATGAAAGLAAAFNAPLAGICLLSRDASQFRYTLISIKAVFIGVIMLTIMYRIFNHEVALIDVGKLSMCLNTLWLYLFLGIIFGILALFLINGCWACRICCTVCTAAILPNGY